MPNNYLAIAKQQEEEAKILAKKTKDKSVLVSAFEEVGDSFVNAGYPDNARENYLRALNYSKLKSDKERIEWKIEKIHSPRREEKEIFDKLKSGLE
jgi:predicted negative regulator of RcsB-dependent stress response